MLELVYLVAGNLVVKSSLVKKAVASAEGFNLDYDTATTWWPGHVSIRNLTLRFEDYNVQFELSLERAKIDIALRELPFNRFRATKLTAEGTRFRMRHKLIVVGEDAERVAAYPPIRGFADPPYFTGVRSPPIPDEEYDLWSVQIENVSARVSELWVQEYRFSGRGEARGSFVVRPARWVQVEPASLTLESGTLTLGEHLVAGEMSGKLECSIPDMHVQATEGSAVFREISARAELKLTRGRLDFLRAYLARLGGDVSYSGAADWEVALKLQRGEVMPASRVELSADPLRLRRKQLSLAGALHARLERPVGADRLRLSWAAPRLEARRGGSREGAPTIEGLTGELELLATHLDRELGLGQLRAQVQRVSAPSLGWLPLPNVHLRGSANAAASLAMTEDGRLSGKAHLNVTDGRLRRGELAAAADLSGQLALTRESAEAPLRLGRLELLAERATLQNGEQASEPFWARLDGSGLEVALQPKPVVNGKLALHVSSTEALLPLLVSRPLREVGDALVSLGDLRASARIKVESGGVELSGLDARDGKLRLRGHLVKRGKDPSGKLLVSAGPLNVGVRFEQGSTAVAPFVGDDWLAAALTR